MTWQKSWYWDHLLWNCSDFHNSQWPLMFSVLLTLKIVLLLYSCSPLSGLLTSVVNQEPIFTKLEAHFRAHWMCEGLTSGVRPPSQAPDSHLSPYVTRLFIAESCFLISHLVTNSFELWWEPKTFEKKHKFRSGYIRHRVLGDLGTCQSPSMDSQWSRAFTLITAASEVVGAEEESLQELRKSNFWVCNSD